MSLLKKIFILTTGPKYNLEAEFQERCLHLSKNFTGVVLTSGPSREIKTFGNFVVIRIKDPFIKSWIGTLKYLMVSFKILFISILKGDRFDIFTTYDPLKTGLIGAVVCFFTKTKLVVEVNGDYTKDVIYREIKNPLKRQIKKKLMISVASLVLNRADGVKLLFDTQIDYFKPLKRDPIISRFPSYVDAERFKLISDEKTILFVGFPFWIKGVDILIESFKTISDEFPEWTLKILGYYPDKTLMNKYMANHTKIIYHPPVARTLIPEHIGRCGIFVLPSRTEGMGRVLIEAMAAEKPRIGARVGGISTVIEDGKDGMLFESENVNDLAEKLRSLLLSDELRKKYGTEAKRRYLNEFTQDNYFNSLTSFYSNILCK